MEYKSTRDAYGEALVELGKENPNVVVLSADLGPSTKVGEFAKQFPERFYEIGISEQDMTGIAAGLSFTGKIPFTSSFGVFTPGNCYGQVRLSIAFSKANVKIAATHCGIDFHHDGASAQIIEDIAMMRALPEMKVIAPCDYYEAKKAVHKAAQMHGPVYIRLGRNAWPVITDYHSHFEIGKAEVFREGGDASIVACGQMVHKALKAAEILQREHINVRVVNCHTIKPIDRQMLIESAQKTGHIVTAEDHNVLGGLGSAVSEVLSEHYPVPMRFIGVKDRFGQSGTPDKLAKEYGLTADNICDAVRDVLKQK